MLAVYVPHGNFIVVTSDKDSAGMDEGSRKRRVGFLCVQSKVVIMTAALHVVDIET